MPNIQRYALTVLIACSFASTSFLSAGFLFGSKDPWVALGADVEKRGFLLLNDSSLGVDYEAFSIDTLRAKIAAVQGQPLPLRFGRTVLSKPLSGLKNMINGISGVQEALVQTVIPEEGAQSYAYLLRPLNGEFKTWSKAVQGSETAGKRAIKLALKLRRQARISKFKFFVESHSGKSFSALSDRDLDKLRLKSEYLWLLEDVFEPVVILFDPELVKKKGRNLMKVGPAYGGISTLCVMQPDDFPGKRWLKKKRGFVVDKKTGQYIVVRSDSVIILQDLGRNFSVGKAIETDILGDVIGHELFHGIMGDLMVQDTPDGSRSKSNAGHDAPIVTDEYLAFSEGWAECFEAWSGKENPTFLARNDRSNVPDFVLGRQEPIRRNRYVQGVYEWGKQTKPTARLKTGSAMMACEGLVASLFYELVMNDKIPDVFERIFSVMSKDRPIRTSAFFEALGARAVDPKVKRAILIPFLHMSKFATVSAEARSFYQDAYEMELALKNAMNEGLPTDEIQELQEAQKTTRAIYEDFVDPLVEKVLAGELPLDTNIGPEIWLDFTVGRERPITHTVFNERIRLNLNTADYQDFVEVGFAPDDIEELVAGRDRAGFFSDIEEVRRVARGCYKRVKAALVSP